MNIGVLGGTFNPVHNGHLHIAESACKEIPLDRLLWVPTALPPLKPQEKLIDVKLRYEMVRLAIQGYPQWEVCDLELDSTKPSYTVHTLEKLSKGLSGSDKLYLIIGSDNLAQFPQWKESSRILKLAEVVAMTRPGYSLRFAQGPMRLIPIRAVNVSSSKIRKAVAAGSSVQGMAPEAVRRFIEEKRLYAD